MARRGPFRWIKSAADATAAAAKSAAAAAKSLIQRKPPPAPPVPPAGKHESGVPVSDILRRLRTEGEAPPPEPPAKPGRHVEPPASRSDVAEYAADTRSRLDIREHDKELSQADVDSLIRSLGVNNALTIAREQNESTREFERGHYEPGHSRYANQVAVLERMLGRVITNLASHRSSKLTFSQDYVQWFWYHGKKSL